MDEIVRGLFHSSHSEHVKKQIFKKLRLSAPNGFNRLSVSQQKNLLDVCISYFLLGEFNEHHEAALLLQDFIPLCESGCYDMFGSKFFENIVLGKFVPSQFSSLYLEVPPSTKIIISRRISLLEVLLKEFYRQNLSKLLVYVHVCIKTEVIRLLYDSVDHATFAQLCSFLKRYDECMPPSSRRFAVCTISIRAMSDFFPLGNDMKSISSYIEDIDEISDFINFIWLKEPATVDPSLLEVFNIISQSTTEEPSNALACLVRYIPEQLIRLAVVQIVNKTDVSDKSMTAALTRMVAWLGWPIATQAHLWVLAFLQELANSSKFSILRDVTVTTIKQVFNCLKFPVTRTSAMPVLIHMLMSHQESDDAFRCVVPLIPEMIMRIENEHEAENETFLKQLANLCHCMMRLHSGFPELYSPIIEALKMYPVPTLRAMETALSYSMWTPAHRHVVCEGEMVLPRKSCDKVGLVNLGNTCYVNSIVQALFMVDEFRCAMLEQSSSPFTISGCLAKTFAFLLLTERTSYKPTELVERSRPPWFQPGVQQDCTEYLKYLLGQLEKEEEKMAHTSEQDGRALDSAKCEPQTDGHVPNKIPTTVENLFHGKVKSTIKCTLCNTTSSREEDFAEFALPLPGTPPSTGRITSLPELPQASSGDHPVQVQDDEDEETRKHHRLKDLLHTAFTDELLEGDNQYRCNICCSLTDAVKSIGMTALPRHLLLTLLRTTFNPKQQRKSKLMDKVDTPEDIQVPLCKGDETKLVNYTLIAVVVHSGLSTDSGHYYIYGKQGGCWFIFNDSHVSVTSFDSMSQSASQFARDTAYVLVYTQDVAMATISREQHVVGRSLRDVIDADNRLFQKEMEEAAKRPSRKSFSNVLGWRDDDNPPPPSCGGGFGGGFSNRYVF